MDCCVESFSLSKVCTRECVHENVVVRLPRTQEGRISGRISHHMLDIPA